MNGNAKALKDLSAWRVSQAPFNDQKWRPKNTSNTR